MLLSTQWQTEFFSLPPSVSCYMENCFIIKVRITFLSIGAESRAKATKSFPMFRVTFVNIVSSMKNVWQRAYEKLDICDACLHVFGNKTRDEAKKSFVLVLEKLYSVIGKHKKVSFHRPRHFRFLKMFCQTAETSARSWELSRSLL